jgi:hypothetical protein
LIARHFVDFIQGEPGNPGSKGIQGDPGAVGPTGEKGVQGCRGAPGHVGLVGHPGPPVSNLCPLNQEVSYVPPVIFYVTPVSILCYTRKYLMPLTSKYLT